MQTTFESVLKAEGDFPSDYLLKIVIMLNTTFCNSKTDDVKIHMYIK